MIKDYAKICKPLTSALRKNAKIDPENEEYKNADKTYPYHMHQKPLTINYYRERITNQRLGL